MLERVGGRSGDDGVNDSLCRYSFEKESCVLDVEHAEIDYQKSSGNHFCFFFFCFE